MKTICRVAMLMVMVLTAGAAMAADTPTQKAGKTTATLEGVGGAFTDFVGNAWKAVKRMTGLLDDTTEGVGGARPEPPAKDKADTGPSRKGVTDQG